MIFQSTRPSNATLLLVIWYCPAKIQEKPSTVMRLHSWCACNGRRRDVQDSHSEGCGNKLYSFLMEPLSTYKFFGSTRPGSGSMRCPDAPRSCAAFWSGVSQSLGLFLGTWCRERRIQNPPYPRPIAANQSCITARCHWTP